MSRVTVGKWGKSLAIRVPFAVAEAAGLTEGEKVVIEARQGDIVIRRPGAGSRADAEAAAEEIMAESHRYSLGKIVIRELLDEGRRG